MLQSFGPRLHIAEGPTVSFFGFPYPTRSAIIELESGGCWVWSPVALDDALAEAVEAMGPVRHLVSPNKIHHLFLQEWAERWPQARLWASPGLSSRKPELNFDGELGDRPDPDWAGEIDQVVFRGSVAMEEVVFFHRPSSTVLACDLIQRFPEDQVHGWKGALMRLDGLVGEAGSTPREWRATFLKRKAARAARRKVLDWHPRRLLIAHGTCADAGAEAIIEQALGWI